MCNHGVAQEPVVSRRENWLLTDGIYDLPEQLEILRAHNKVFNNCL